MRYLSLENIGHGLFHNDAHEVEDKVPELKKGLEQITRQDRDMPLQASSFLVLEIFTESDEAQRTELSPHFITSILIAFHNVCCLNFQHPFLG